MNCCWEQRRTSKHKTLGENYKISLIEKEKTFNEHINKYKQKHFDNRVFFEMEITNNRDCFWEFVRPYVSEKELKAGKYV